MRLMRFGAILTLFVGVAAAAVAASADPASASAVYIMPMAGGMDQYIALRLTTDNVILVVTDPQKADVVMTDNIGSGFQDKWKELYPPPAPPKTDDKDKDKDKDKDIFTVEHGVSQPMARGRGAYFLIDRQTRNVIWSTYARPKSAQPEDVTRTAEQIAKELAKARKPKTAKE